MDESTTISEKVLQTVLKSMQSFTADMSSGEECIPLRISDIIEDMVKSHDYASIQYLVKLGYVSEVSEVVIKLNLGDEIKLPYKKIPARCYIGYLIDYENYVRLGWQFSIEHLYRCLTMGIPDFKNAIAICNILYDNIDFTNVSPRGFSCKLSNEAKQWIYEKFPYLVGTPLENTYLHLHK